MAVVFASFSVKASYDDNADLRAGEPSSAIGTINTVNLGTGYINISHEPVADVHWPSMRMDFPVDGSINLSSFKKGDHVRFTFSPNSQGTFTIHSLWKIP